ncbi:Sec14p-like phosphatidylinositol transfer family protein [Euphorbia peplus]|nr:Sec14p-like phosphatidylinositol transfer family protein [Euphorbia peplus]
MAEETKPASAAPAEEVVVVEKPELSSAPEPEPAAPAVEEVAVESVTEEEAEKPKEEVSAEDVKIAQSVSFKEETNVVADLPDVQKKALDDLKQLIQEALNKHELSAPPPPPPVKEEEKPAEPEKAAEEKVEEAKVEEVKEEEKTEAPAPAAASTSEEPKPEEPEAIPPPAPAPAPVEVKEEEKPAEEVVVATVVDEDGAKTVEAIEESVVAVASSTPAPEETTEAAEEAKTEEAPAVPPPPPEEVLIWGIKLLEDEKSDVVLLKFLRARDFKVKDAFTMIKNTVRWRKEFGIEALLEEDLGNELDKAVFMHGVDKEGHPVCYNVYGAFQDKELYQKCFSDEEKRVKFLRWRIQFLEKSIRKLDFSPNGICTIVQVNDLKNSPGPAKRELRQATNQAVALLQDNYPEFVARQVFINVPWWYLAFNRMISPFLTLRTKSKMVFAGPSKSAETLLKYIPAERVPVQLGGLSKEGEQEFTEADSVTEVTIKPTSKHTIEFSFSEKCLLVWELRVLGWDVSYGAEFDPGVEGGYTVIVSKTRKVSPTDEPVICDNFKISESGKVTLTIDNQTSKKKKLLYRLEET